jgi:ADP-dependent NAD(P)H-hydrate dehydratase / NAD(P)H-hydrate epimerase
MSTRTRDDDPTDAPDDYVPEAAIGLDIRALRARWADRADLPPMTAEEMAGADRRAQAVGIPGRVLMERAGTAAAALALAILADTERDPSSPILVLGGPGNNGGDGFVLARRLARAGRRVVAVLVATEARPRTPDAAANWARLAHETGVTVIHAPAPRDIAVLEPGIERAGLVVDALLGTGVAGALREPIRSAVNLCLAARSAGVPVLAIDAPTAVDLTSGDPSDPVVRADATITFHRPKKGLLDRRGKALAGRVLVAPIGIPVEADRA